MRLGEAGNAPRAAGDQRYERAYLFGAVCPQRRAAAALVMPTANTKVMSLHLAEIARNVAPGAHAALVLDGAGYHIADDLKVPPNITLVPLPRYAPELNPMENVWEYLRGNKLAITVFDKLRRHSRHHFQRLDVLRKRQGTHRHDHKPILGDDLWIHPVGIRPAGDQLHPRSIDQRQQGFHVAAGHRMQPDLVSQRRVDANHPL